MWLITPFGFFSVVQKPAESDLTVRARVGADLDRLREHYMPTLAPTTTSTHTDYRFRATISHEAYALGLAEIARDIHYSNFKSEVGRVDPTRAHVYARVWEVLWKLQNDE